MPLVVHQLGLQWLDSVLTGTTFSIMPYRPNWALWYLMSLVLWRVSLPLVMAFRFPLLVSLALAIGVGFFNRIGYDWSLSRTAVFMPFFIAGHLWAIRKGRDVPSFPPHVALIGILEVAVVAWLALRIDMRWLYGALSYESLGVSWPRGVIYRSSLIAVGFLGALCVLSLIPSSSVLARLGRHSMAAFIFHIYVAKLLIAAGFTSLLESMASVLGIAFATLTALAIAALGVAVGSIIPHAFDFSWAIRRPPQLSNRGEA